MQTCDHSQQTEKVGRALSLPAIIVRSCSLNVLSLPQNKIIMTSLCFCVGDSAHRKLRGTMKKTNLVGAADEEICRES